MEFPASAQRFKKAATKAGLEIDIMEMPDSTRTAEEAAAACKCAVGQIVKSLVFTGHDSGDIYMLLVSGSNRVNQKGIAAEIGETLDRPEADFVRTHTSYAIGGIPPLGHTTQLKTWFDKDLLQYETVFAAAGTPRCIFGIDPQKLATAANATITSVT